MGLFTAKPAKPLPIVHEIREMAGVFPISEEYATEGLDEGWLYLHTIFELNGELHFVYLLTS